MKTVVTAVVCLIVGYWMTSSIYSPKVEFYMNRAQELDLEVSKLTQEVKEYISVSTKLIDEKTKTIREKDTLISNVTDEKVKLQAELNVAQKSNTDYKSQINGLYSQISNIQSENTQLQARLSRVLDTSIIQHYDWQNTYSWELTIPLSTYFDFKERPQALSISQYVNLTKDPKHDDFIDQVVDYLNSQVLRFHYNEQQKINFIISFVQSLPYTEDSVTKVADEYPRYPIETLFDRGGDCEDTSILAAAILYRMGYDVALVNPPSHMAIGISLQSAYGRYYDYNGKKYFYLETTGEGWEIGEMPREYINTSARVFPLQ